MVLLLAGISAFSRRAAWSRLPIEPSRRLGFSLLLMIVTLSLTVAHSFPRVQMFFFLVAIGVMILGLYGRHHLRLMLPILIYSLLVIPPPDWLWAHITLGLRYFSVHASVLVLDLLPIEQVIVDGLTLIIPSKNYHLDVADACSGIRSLLNLVVIGTWLVLRARCGWQGKSLLLLLIPLITCTLNVLRIVTITFFCIIGWKDYVAGDMHLMLGFVTGLLGFFIWMAALRLAESRNEASSSCTLLTLSSNEVR